VAGCLSQSASSPQEVDRQWGIGERCRKVYPLLDTHVRWSVGQAI